MAFDHPDAGWRYNLGEIGDPEAQDFWPSIGFDEGRRVCALLDQGMLNYEDGDDIHPPTVIYGTLRSDVIENERGEEVWFWLVETIDGRYDLGCLIPCWKFNDV